MKFGEDTGPPTPKCKLFSFFGTRCKLGANTIVQQAGLGGGVDSNDRI